MGECVKCGLENIEDAPACAGCTWPMSSGAWQSTTFTIRRVTIDTGCINAKQADPALNQLERWADEGKIVLERSSALLAELTGQDRVSKATSIDPHPGLFTLGSSQLGIDTVLAGSDMSGLIEETLFPTTASLTNNQAADVEHLRSLVLTGSDVFVTRNPRDFIVRGKQDTLARMGIWVFSPNELVEHLRRLYGWT